MRSIEILSHKLFNLNITSILSPLGALLQFLGSHTIKVPHSSVREGRLWFPCCLARFLTCRPRPQGKCSPKTEIEFGKGMALKLHQSCFCTVLWLFVFSASSGYQFTLVLYNFLPWSDSFKTIISSQTFPQEIQRLRSLYFVLLE